MKIAICEDEKVIAQKIWKMFFSMSNITAQYYTDPLQLLKKYENGERYDILFCDICMDSINGIELCRQIRKIDPQIYIVFLTNYIEYAPEGYEVDAFRYLLKPITQEKIEKVLSEIQADIKKSFKILLKTPEGNMIFDGKELLYIEIENKEFRIYTNEDLIITTRNMLNLDEVIQKLPLFRVHRKYFVNLDRVREFDRFRLTLDNGHSLPVSKRNSGDFKKALLTFLENDVDVKR